MNCPCFYLLLTHFRCDSRPCISLVVKYVDMGSVCIPIVQVNMDPVIRHGQDDQYASQNRIDVMYRSLYSEKGAPLCDSANDPSYYHPSVDRTYTIL